MYMHIYTHIYIHMCSHGSQLRVKLLDSLQGLFWSCSLKWMAHPKYGWSLIANLEKESPSGKHSGFGLIAILSCWWVHLSHRCHCCHCCGSSDISSLMSELNPLRSNVGWKPGLSRNLPGLQHRLGQRSLFVGWAATEFSASCPVCRQLLLQPRPHHVSQSATSM